MSVFSKFNNVVFAFSVLLAGCADQTGYNKGLSEASVVKGSSRNAPAAPDVVLRAAKMTLVAKGFSIDSIDSQNGLIKCSRNLPDKEDKDLSYRINGTVDVTPDDAAGSVVTLAANQQTVLHRTVRQWWHLLWIVPLFPIGTEYQTSVLKEGDIVDASAYNDFFVALNKSIPAATKTPATASVADPVAASPQLDALPQ